MGDITLAWSRAAMIRPRTELFPADTTPEARRVHADVLRRMGGDRRLALALRLTDHLRAIAAAGVRARHPEYDEDRVRVAVCRLVLGKQLFRQGYPDSDVVP